jgi:hypothetical protein
MNEPIAKLYDQAIVIEDGGDYVCGELDPAKFAQLIVERCASMCGSQADRKNLRQAFGLPVENDVKYPGPDAHWSITSQYDRNYNLPK